MKAKSYDISKHTVLEAYKKVKANRGAGGVDKLSLEGFDKDLENNLYKIWNRMSSGSYFPPAVKEKQIDKGEGKVRILGIPTVGDRVAQMVAKLHLEPIVEPLFHRDSYGYRPKRSAKQALTVARQRCWKKHWVIDLDIKGFFDNLDHERILKAVRHNTSTPWLLTYIERWLKAPMQLEDGTLQERTKGSPQGGVISPLLANLFMHYAFDTWMEREFPHIQFARYADDVVVHADSKKEAEHILQRIGQRLKECELELHPEKTKIVYCGRDNQTGKHELRKFDFLSYTYKLRKMNDSQGQAFISCNPAVSGKKASYIKETISNWKIPSKCCTRNLNEIAELVNPIVRGWKNYYGYFLKGELQKVLLSLELALIKWAVKKYKRFKGSRKKASTWLKKIARRDPTLFSHWNSRGWGATGL